MQTSLLTSSVLQDELTCPVCLDLYRDPHLLPCGHNFCKTCLDRLKRQAERGHFRCPECRNSHRCGFNFQKNFKLANIADDYRHRRRDRAVPATALKSRDLPSSSHVPHQSRNGFAVPCDYCPSVSTEAQAAVDTVEGSSAAPAFQDMGGRQGAAAPALMFAVKTCLKCEVSMCQEHIKPHLELPAFRMHPLTEPMNDFWKRKCPDHDEIYKYYCIDDKMCVCNACTIEGGHSGHTIKTLKNAMKDFKGTLDKQLYRAERKYSMAEKKLQEQKEKERHNKKFMDDTELCLTRLGEEMKVKVLSFIGRLRECARAHCDINGPTIQKNISRIGQDQARLHEVRCGIESLNQENDPFRFIEVRRITQSCHYQTLRKNLFYPEYVDMETEGEEAPEEEEDDDEDDDDLDDSSEEEMRSEGEEEEDDEEEDGVGAHDDDYSPGEEEEEEEEEDVEEEEEEEDGEEEDDEERGV
uniref:Uncharacterized protein n=1 Tax=Amphilophus citrinellus TaxID=61819 RepID=A0A3Q0RPA9_AMPCI